MDKFNRRSFLGAVAAGSLAAGGRTPQDAAGAVACAPPPQGCRVRIATVCQTGLARIPRPPPRHLSRSARRKTPPPQTALHGVRPQWGKF